MPLDLCTYMRPDTSSFFISVAYRLSCAYVQTNFCLELGVHMTSQHNRPSRGSGAGRDSARA